MEDVLHFIFGILGNVFGAALSLAPVITFYYVIKRGSTEEFSGIPYVTALFNCLLYAWYGLPFVSSDNIWVTVADGSGALMEIIYVCFCLVYSPPKSKKKVTVLFVQELVLFGIIAAVSVVAFKSSARRLLIGILAAAFSICMYSAPLSIMIPNGVGTLLGAAQLVLYWMYTDLTSTSTEDHVESLIQNA